jgi:hypothetical protein
MTVDYETYADGEALLGWLNATVNVSAAESVDGNELLLRLANRLQQRLRDESIEIAHLKMTLTPDEGQDLAVANLVRTDGSADLSHRLAEPVEYAQLILNLRAEADPEALHARVLETLSEVAKELAVELKVEHLERFRPGKPQPTHRLAGV